MMSPQTKTQASPPTATQVPAAAGPGVLRLQSREMSLPDEVKSPPFSKVEIVRMQGKTYSRYNFYPGFHWAEHVGPLFAATHCPGTHFCYQVSGTLRLRMKDGTEMILKAGQAQVIPPGHDAWVVGDEPVVSIVIE